MVRAIFSILQVIAVLTVPGPELHGFRKEMNQFQSGTHLSLLNRYLRLLGAINASNR
jgi:hypothetical protein